jgi:hypothetical protein
MTTDVRGYPLSLVKDLDCGRCRSNVHAFLHQRVGHAAQVGVEDDVVVDAPFRSWAAVRVQRVCKRAQGASDDSEHESAGESIRQCGVARAS